ncbi:beta-glucosidase [Bifidobacterium lemurum]|uniref:Beta-glucosidase n=1 Tax=Bifidobacterium lemurum TaxID=1603886 RepID=A0A261FRS5_9BIFI|nr:glycoside hydrolase family 3 N-terminal domain-containing protein [Bifidobacterium lemurum]OZG61506.1 beta-glucosidase [Bifidobacterium lemurum]QOL35075.1 glycoside hydrolase family 3 C-terminal domain-containing protein [Bifidobacterium lemurum]
MGEKNKTALVVRIVKTVISVAVAAVIIVAMVMINPQLSTNKLISSLMGYNHQSVDNGNADTSGVNTEYYTADYTQDNIRAAEDDLYDRIAEDGTVLLKNDNDTLPMSTDTTFSFFSANSVDGSSLTKGYLGVQETVTLKDAFTAAGFGVNETLWNYYESGAGADYGLASGSINYGDAEDFRINEAPLSALESESGLLESVEGTTPVYVLNRVVGEGRDMPRSMYNHADSQEDKEKSYIELDSTEEEILQYLNDNYDNVILLVKSSAGMELGWVEQYPSIHAIVYSQDVTNALAKVFSGEVNPSGKTVDTFAADALASPAAQNFGSFQYVDEDGNLTKYNYVDYAEGIYVGYKYYETRYEDKVLGQGNAGDYDYAAEVVYPFGYGLSYTDFEWTDFAVSNDGDEFTATVTVTNTGDVAGKDVVELYAQSPYTDYDKANAVEKASVSLVGFGKTAELQPGESETVEITFAKDQLKSYDYTTAKTYILDAGEYRFTAATDANAAVNNILADKGMTVADGMTAEGDAALVSSWTPQNTEVDTTTFATDTETGVEITNLFDDASDPEVTYLTRSDWTGTFPQRYGEASDEINTWGNEINCTDADGNNASCTWVKPASDELIAQLDSTDSGTDVDRDSITDTPTFGANNGLTVADMRGLDYDDAQWDDLLDQLTKDDYTQLIYFSGYGVDYISSVQKPFQTDADAANGWFYGGTGKGYPSIMMLAQTWNADLAEELGEMMGNEALLGGADGWYAPAMNIHRTPFSGRNGEYYSEDPFMSGMMASLEVKGAASKGVYSYIKHFALNDQENHRGDRPGNYSVTTWSNEQAIREMYVKPFEMCMKLGDQEINYVKQNADGTYENATAEVPVSMALMTSFNRVGATWAGGNHSLIQELVRDEWGFNGLIITDNANTGVFMSPYQMLEAGADIKLLNVSEDPSGEELDLNDSATYHYARQAMHHLLYTVANTKCMNGAMPGAKFTFYNQMKVMQVAFNTVCGVLLALLAFFSVWRWLPWTIRRVAARKQRRADRRAAKKEAKANNQ